jgi:hypothetical protein
VEPKILAVVAVVLDLTEDQTAQMVLVVLVL